MCAPFYSAPWKQLEEIMTLLSIKSIITFNDSPFGETAPKILLNNADKFAIFVVGSLDYSYNSFNSKITTISTSNISFRKVRFYLNKWYIKHRNLEQKNKTKIFFV